MENNETTTIEKRLIYQNPAGYQNKKANYANYMKYCDDFIEVCKKQSITVTAEIWANLWRLRTVSVIVDLMQKQYQDEVSKLPEIMQKTAPPFNPIKQRVELQNHFDCLRFIENMDHVNPLLTTIGKDGKCCLVKDADLKIKREFEMYVENEAQAKAVEICKTIEESFKELVELIEKSGFNAYDFLHNPKFGMVFPQDDGNIGIDYTMLRDICER